MDDFMTFEERKKQFELNKPKTESVILRFIGVDGFDVYNCSIPFEWQGETYLFGRVEKREEWARSWARLFKRTAPDEYTLVPDSMIYQMEDPFISTIGNELVLGGTHVRYRSGKIDTFFGYFYKGKEIGDLYYFTTGPEFMKDIRLVELDDGIGVFSRPRGDHVRTKYGSDSIVGFAKINNLMELTADVVENAPIVEGLFGAGEWGGCNQCYHLDSGYIGIIGHKSYRSTDEKGNSLSVYVNVSHVMDPKTNRILDEKILATRSCYPDAPPKMPELADCVFTSGIVMRPDGKADLYSGLGDTKEGRIVIDDPFEGFGKII